LFRKNRRPGEIFLENLQRQRYKQIGDPDEIFEMRMKMMEEEDKRVNKELRKRSRYPSTCDEGNRDYDNRILLLNYKNLFCSEILEELKHIK